MVSVEQAVEAININTGSEQSELLVVSNRIGRQAIDFDLGDLLEVVDFDDEEPAHFVLASVGLRVIAAIEDLDKLLVAIDAEAKRLHLERRAPGSGLHLRRRVEDPRKMDPGEGYRLLRAGEVIEEGDEFLDPQGSWVRAFFSVGFPLDAYDRAFRRRYPGVESDGREVDEERRPAAERGSGTDPGEGYRLLDAGEVIEEGDEYISEYPSARPMTWRPYRRLVGHRNTLGSLSSRRKLPNVTYRSLRVGEVIEEGDEYLSFSGRWTPCDLTVGKNWSGWERPTRRRTS
jgi:hypothetical protein